MRPYYAAGLGLLLIAASPAVGAAGGSPATVDDLAWIAGDWSRAAGESWTEENWTPPRGGVMLGVGRSGRGDALGAFEFLRIAAGETGTLAYIAQPGGGAAVAFALVRHEGTSATFENAAHDYPQRITYARDGDGMTATISLLDGSRPQSWTFRRR